MTPERHENRVLKPEFNYAFLLVAAEAGDIDATRRELSLHRRWREINVGSSSPWKSEAFHRACLRGHIAVAEAFMDDGMCPHDSQSHALRAAAADDRIDVLRVLLSRLNATNTAGNLLDICDPHTASERVMLLLLSAPAELIRINSSTIVKIGVWHPAILDFCIARAVTIMTSDERETAIRELEIEADDSGIARRCLALMRVAAVQLEVVSCEDPVSRDPCPDFSL